MSKGNLNRRNRRFTGQDQVDMGICKRGGCAYERRESMGVPTQGAERM